MRNSAIVWFSVVFVFGLALCAASPAIADWIEDGTALCNELGDQLMPVIIPDGGGGAIIAWQDLRGSDYDIYVQRIDAWGAVQWTADGTALCTVAGDQTDPAIVSDGAGGAIVAWWDGRGDVPNVYAQRIDASGAVQWTADGVVLCDSTASGDYPFLGVLEDGSGGAFVAWADSRWGDSDIYAQRVNASGTVQWTASGVAVCTAVGDQFNCRFAPDGASGVIVSWQDERAGVQPDIYAQRVSGTGTPQWTADGVALCTATGTQAGPRITSDGGGGAIVTWFDRRSGVDDIYAQRINASGAVQWTTDGAAVCTASGIQYSPDIVSDGSGGALVAWYDHRNADYDIYAQRINNSGAVQWTTDGVALCTASGEQLSPRTVSDELGGAIVTWIDSRGADYDIYAQRIDGAGTVGWTTDGVAVCEAMADQRNPVIAFDGDGGAIVAWRDYRNGGPAPNSDIYAARVFWAGTTDAPYDHPISETRLFQNVPNPFGWATRIAFRVERAGHARLMVFDAQGRLIRVLVDETRQPNEYVESWDGMDGSGRRVAAGAYFYSLETPDGTASKKMTLAR
jgi:hypothetical protein